MTREQLLGEKIKNLGIQLTILDSLREYKQFSCLLNDGVVYISYELIIVPRTVTIVSDHARTDAFQIGFKCSLLIFEMSLWRII